MWQWLNFCHALQTTEDYHDVDFDNCCSEYQVWKDIIYIIWRFCSFKINDIS